MPMFKQCHSLSAKVETICVLLCFNVCEVHAIVHLYFLSKLMFLSISFTRACASHKRLLVAATLHQCKDPKEKLKTCIKDV